jgi:hypothetical protein
MGYGWNEGEGKGGARKKEMRRLHRFAGMVLGADCRLMWETIRSLETSDRVEERESKIS